MRRWRRNAGNHCTYTNRGLLRLRGRSGTHDEQWYQKRQRFYLHHNVKVCSQMSHRNMAHRTLSREAASTGLAAVRQAARQSRDVRFTALLHHITIDLLKQSYTALKRDAAPGTEGVSWQSFGENLEAKLKDLHERAAVIESASQAEFFSMVGAMGSPTALAAQDIVLDARVPQIFPLTSAEFTFRFDPPNRRNGSNSTICRRMSIRPGRQSNT